MNALRRPSYGIGKLSNGYAFAIAQRHHLPIAIGQSIHAAGEGREACRGVVGTPLGDVRHDCMAEIGREYGRSRALRLELHDLVVGDAQGPGEEVGARLELIELLP